MEEKNIPQNQPKRNTETTSGGGGSKVCLWVALVILILTLITLAVVFFGCKYIWKKATTNLNATISNLNQNVNSNSSAELSAAEKIVTQFEDLNKTHNDVNAKTMLSLFTPASTSADKEQYDFFVGADNGGIYRLFATNSTSYKVSEYEVLSQEMPSNNQATFGVREKRSYYNNVNSSYGEAKNYTLTFQMVKNGTNWQIDRYMSEDSDLKYSGFVPD